MLDRDNVFRSGKYKDKKLSEVPGDYLQFLIEKNYEANQKLQREVVRRYGKRFYPEGRPGEHDREVEVTKIRKVISGGQTGADQAALIAANSLDIKTGGYAPEYYVTEDGPCEWLKDFGLKEGGKYQDAYGWNAPECDAAIVFGIKTGGASIVASVCGMSGKPWKHVYWKGEGSFADDPWHVAEWLHQHSVKVLLVAGNRERKNPGIGEAVAGFMLQLLETVNSGRKDERRF